MARRGKLFGGEQFALGRKELLAFFSHPPITRISLLGSRVKCATAILGMLLAAYAADLHIEALARSRREEEL